MSWLSDTWKGIQSSFDINKMKRDPLGSAAKLAMIYGVGSAAFSAIAPDTAADVSKWMKGGFGFYDDPAPRPGQGHFTKSQKLKTWDKPYRAPGGKGGFWERQVKGVGAFAAKPFDLGMNVNKWIKGDISWSDVWGGDSNGYNYLKQTQEMLGTGPSGQPAGRPGDRRQERKKVTHRDFQRGSPAGAAQISQAREGGMYKPGGISQALITGAITPEQLALLRYGAGSVAAQERNIALEDVGKIKTTLRSAV